MRIYLLLCLALALLSFVMGDENADYTGRYAELAQPVPDHVNVDELVANLRSASNVES